MPKTQTLDDRIDQLYAGPVGSFIANRDALAKTLKAGGDKEGAAVVKALRKPTAAASAVNQLAHSARRDVAKLLDVGDDLRSAHEALADGKGDAGIRAATTKRRKLVATLTDKAVARLGAGGEAHREAISTTLDAAVADPDAAIEVQQGRLVKELPAPSGFGAGLVFAPAPAPPRESAARRDERRAARAAARTSPRSGRGDADMSASARPDETKVGQRAEADRKARVAMLEAESQLRTSDAQQAARDASASRQEVSRLQDLLVSANAKSKAADERARLAQWSAATTQQALRDASISE